MTDTLSPADRSERMRRVRARDTRPELRVRQLIHSMGFRYRLHRRELPGTPDLVFPSRRAIIFVHGCFWHRHPAATCRRARLPKSRTEFWVEKLTKNRIRDGHNENKLRDMGWRVMTIWECEIGSSDLAVRINTFLRTGALDESS